MDKVISLVYKYRKEKELTQEELAAKVGVTRQTIIAMEKGNYTPSVALALKLAKFFRIEVSELFRLKRK
ncbi:transcriptional regulator [Candidatus Gottesmanbacteria bacterium RIFCSPHIGHO2_02_FULL_40_24]|uniref:Transcriptional regulator n=1 Tax=Candidatus Gottesmanbacteria bacterium RIFCSPHIGHO2_01_FULL_40_15 TaxID=1798376 RepID=A0A1F5YZM5_9BACT|nr:MAG: transcriptional regulator [Candidatus Gottesmanbacteria bacterium RIFCSPHIGHO2_01_FULL_40_15]OGG17051.1 MAG: transcriptional regulator [Candidatus Gottesmanbacteria bacterium RIFCSPHIGHO2_02_FULL_40_24]OGG21305.1 MAG: transcriptional regulator [Candidatus Gottesmanbacteria bacterium RIFCSPLOWO2_01_FULL_40_10]OGG23429.1 MAG: transcriptional regulator [Candidatus Gottesmanbacteria bacterium RIFCSPHIGHO2_12_FULL_40_13]OGG33028.1 MAG: transcriptional regulator [Candidatus Gottesmanbacteria 